MYSAWFYILQMMQLSVRVNPVLFLRDCWRMTDLSRVGIWRHYCSDQVWRLASLAPDILNVMLHPQSITYNHNHGHNTGKTVKHTSQLHDTLSYLQLSKFFSFQNEELLCFFFCFFSSGMSGKAKMNQSRKDHPPWFRCFLSISIENSNSSVHITRFERVLN